MKQRIFYLLGLLMPFFLLFVLLMIDIQIDGVLEGSLIPNKRTPFLYAPLPDTRIEESIYKDVPVYDMSGEPAYFSLRLPKTPYDVVKIGITFIPVDQTIFELGPEAADGANAFDLKPLYAKALETLPWSAHQDKNGVTIFEKSLRQTYSRSNIATYAYDFPEAYRDIQYEPSKKRTIYDVDLRGAHRMKTYIKNEALDMRFTFTDMNRDIGRDDIVIHVFDEDHRIVREMRIDDDGNERSDQEVTRHDISVFIPDLLEGVYDIEIKTTTDLFLRTLDTAQQKFVFVNRLYVGDAVGWREQPAHTNYIGNGQAYTIQTLHREGLQTVYFDQSSIALSETHTQEQFILQKPKDHLRIQVPKGDVLLVSEGMFALSEDTFFMPDPRVIGPFTDIASLGVDAVYTTYMSPKKEGEWLTAEQTFDARAWWRDGRKSVRFALSAPFIATHEGHIYIKRISVRFEKRPIRTLGAFLSALRERIPFGL